MNNHHKIRENPNLPDEPLNTMWKLNLECLLPTTDRDLKNSNPGEIERGAVRLINDLPTKWVKSRVDLILEFFVDI